MFNRSLFGNVHDAPEGRELFDEISCDYRCFILMDKAYEGDYTGKKAEEQGFTPVVPPKSNRIDPWEYDKELYKRQNPVYVGVIIFAMLFDAILM